MIYIDTQAFYRYTSLTSVIILYSVTFIGSFAFFKTPITEINIPNSVRTIGRPTIPAGTHTLTWSYTKDSSFNREGDYFAVDNVILSLPTVQPGDVNGDGDVTIADVSALIDYLLGN